MIFRTGSLPEKKTPDWQYLAALFAFVVCVFWKLVLTDDYSLLTYPDNAFQGYPWLQYLSGVLHRRSFPLWDMYTDGGRCFVGEPNTGAFYPLNWLMGVLPLNRLGLLPVAVIDGFVLFHCFLASALMYGLARHLGLRQAGAFIAAVVWACSGSVASRAFAQLNIFFASIWVPAVFLFLSKSLRSTGLRDQILYSNLAGLFLAFCFLAGHHQPFIYSGLAVLCVVLAAWVTRPQTRTLTVRVAAMVFLFAFAYGSLQIFASAEYAPMAYRWVDSPNPVAGEKRLPYSLVGFHNSLPPQGMLLMVFPYLSATENSPYFGVVALLFVLYSLTQWNKSGTVRLSWLIAVLFVSLSLGSFSPLHGLFYALVPAFDKGRAAGRLLLISHAAVSLLAGFGCQAFISAIAKKERIFKLRIVQVFMLLSLLASFVVLASYFYRLQVLGQPSDFNFLFFNCFLLLAVSGVAVARFFRLVSPKYLTVAVVLLLLFDFHLFLSPHLKLKSDFDGKTNFDPSQYYRKDDVVDFLLSRPGTFRVNFRDDSYPLNIGHVQRLETIQGYAPTRLKQFMDFLGVDYSAGGRIHDLLNVKYIVSSQELPLQRVFEGKRAGVYENPDCLPRAWLVKQATEKHNVEEIRSLLLNPSFNLREEAVLEEPPELASNSPNTSSRAFASDAQLPREVSYQRFGPNRFRLEAETVSSSLLIVSENSYPGWKVTVNGVPDKLRRVNGALMGVWLNPGRATVEFTYRPTWLYWGLSLALASFLTLLTVWVARFRTRLPSLVTDLTRA
jgi:Bacterial membrane protein YfhO